MKRSTLDEEKLASAFVDGYWRVKGYSEVESTQDLIRQSQPQHGDVIAADFQSKGRGRLDRSFESQPEAGLLFSFYLQPELKKEVWGILPLLVGMTVAQTLNEICDVKDYKTKWPNDVLSTGGKVSGILCESFSDGVIVGIGINVNATREQLPVPNASSIFLETGQKQDRTEILIHLLNNLKKMISTWKEGRDLIADYIASSATIGELVQVTIPGGDVITSKAIGVSSDGALELENGDRITVGDVVHLR